MSVEDAEAYAARHQLEDRLTAAVNSALAEMPADPFTHMAAYLRAHASEPPSAPPAPSAGAQLLPEVSKYMTDHAVLATLEKVVAVLAAEMPADAIGELAAKLEAKASAGGASRFGCVADVRDASVLPRKRTSSQVASAVEIARARCAREPR